MTSWPSCSKAKTRGYALFFTEVTGMPGTKIEEVAGWMKCPLEPVSCAARTSIEIVVIDVCNDICSGLFPSHFGACKGFVSFPVSDNLAAEKWLE